VLLGVLLLGAAGGVWWDARDTAFGAEGAERLGAGPPALVPLLTAPLDRLREPEASSARLADLDAPVEAPPVEVSLGGRSAPVRPVGLEPTGEVEVPVDVDEVGWYRFGSVPGGAEGSAVLVGHVDAAGQGLGVFAELRRLEPGAPVEVRRADGDVAPYVVLAREQWDKTEAPMTRLFDTTGAHRLVLISCAGAFDPATRSYRDNVAVTAVPAP
jgi:hypothetical protein